ncbi:MAG TPA: CarD family transcriptional regulator, partial [Hyphomicrobiaceae bacterium]|nr:CarD family transcriptional regulator [Hyphomicrobiaceae bacterium]
MKPVGKPAPAKVNPDVKVAAKPNSVKVVAKPAAKAPAARPVTPQKAQPIMPPPAAAARPAPVQAMPAATGAKPVVKVAIGAPPRPTPSPAQGPAAASATAAGPKKPVSQRHGFKMGEFIIYPTHGIGRIVGIEEQEIAGISLELFVIHFEKDKMTLRVPTAKLQAVGMRKLSEDGIVSRAMETLKGRARIKRTMWSRRAQEYEAKINSGDLVAIAEVVRDLYRAENQPEQSYSERQLYEAALDRMAREIAAIERI